MMKNKRIFVFLLICILLLCSCNNSRFSDEELAASARTLIESSAELNEIFFGKGLPVDEEASAVKEGEEAAGNYCPVTNESPYKTEEELKAAAESVFSEGYLKTIYESAFEGTEDSRPRYGTDSEGRLTRDITAREKETGEWTKWNYETIKIKSASSANAVFSIEGTFRDRTETEVMQMVHTANGWRLDSPTY